MDNPESPNFNSRRGSLVSGGVWDRKLGRVI